MSQIRIRFPHLQTVKRPCFVYLFTTEENLVPQKCKIGITTQLINRLSKVEHSSGHKLYVHHIIPCESPGQARAVEQSLHNLYWQQRLRGEWFFLGITDIETISECRSAHHLLEKYNNGDFFKDNRAA